MDTFGLFPCFIMVLIHSQGSLSQITITNAPQNQAVLAGTSISFECKVQQAVALTDYISWEECITPVDGTCRRISNDLTIVYSALGGDPARQTRYNVTSQTTNQYNLHVADVRLTEDAGKYRCLSRNDANVMNDAELVILESDTSCAHNISVNATYPGVLPSVYIMCIVTYNGTLEPLVQFNKEDITANTNTTIGSGIDVEMSMGGGGTTMRYTLTYQLLRGDEGNMFYARTYFSAPSGGSDAEATNAPSYEHVLKFGPLSGADMPYPHRKEVFVLLVFAFLLKYLVV